MCLTYPEREEEAEEAEEEEGKEVWPPGMQKAQLESKL